MHWKRAAIKDGEIVWPTQFLVAPFREPEIDPVIKMSERTTEKV
jgi:hypothetical protein